MESHGYYTPWRKGKSMFAIWREGSEREERRRQRAFFRDVLRGIREQERETARLRKTCQAFCYCDRERLTSGVSIARTSRAGLIRNGWKA